ncbi:MAG: hypothetical protein KAU01_07585 [Candidatus Cloacimonetes bacterium]|nr:hypothetical protein [Candidatus Cloacimonadota bacterium]
MEADISQPGNPVLAKIFQGELVIIEAALAKMENRSYEISEELLERIREEKKKLGANKKKGKYRKQ